MDRRPLGFEAFREELEEDRDRDFFSCGDKEGRLGFWLGYSYLWLKNECTLNALFVVILVLSYISLSPYSIFSYLICSYTL